MDYFYAMFRICTKKELGERLLHELNDGYLSLVWDYLMYWMPLNMKPTTAPRSTDAESMSCKLPIDIILLYPNLVIMQFMFNV
jgi:hypothetical protein